MVDDILGIGRKKRKEKTELTEDQQRRKVIG